MLKFITNTYKPTPNKPEMGMHVLNHDRLFYPWRDMVLPNLLSGKFVEGEPQVANVPNAVSFEELKRSNMVGIYKVIEEDENA